MCFVSCLGAFDLSIYSTCGLSLVLGAAAAESLQETLEGLPAARRSSAVGSVLTIPRQDANVAA